MTPDHAWEHLSDFSTLGDWLKMHQGWRCELPAELEVGTTLVGVAGVKGMRNRVTWTVRELDAPTLLAITGDGVGGTKYGLRMTVEPTESGCDFTVKIDVGGRPLFGPSVRPPPGWSKATSSARSSGSRSSTAEAPRRIARNSNPAPNGWPGCSSRAPSTRGCPRPTECHRPVRAAPARRPRGLVRPGTAKNPPRIRQEARRNSFRVQHHQPTPGVTPT